MRISPALLVAALGAIAPAAVVAQRPSVGTRVAIQQVPLTALVDSGSLVIVKRTPETILASARPIVRANSAWSLVAVLVAPKGSELSATVQGSGEKIELDAEHPQAIVATSARACARCEVPLSWQFNANGERESATSSDEGKTAKKGTPPLMALPVVRYVVQSVTSAGAAKSDRP